jgi:hypothetical protein
MPAGLTDSNEQINYFGGTFSVPVGSSTFVAECAYINAMPVKVYGASFDDCGVTLDGTAARFEGYFVHFENPGITTTTPYVTFGTNATGAVLTLKGEVLQEDSTSARTNFITDASMVSGGLNYISLEDVGVAPQETIAELINITGLATDRIALTDVQLPMSVIAPVSNANVVDYFSYSNPNLPTISSGFGGGARIVVHTNGAANFEINVGKGGAAASGVITMPFPYSRGWTCDARDISNPASALTRQSASSPTTVTFTNYNNAGRTIAWSTGDILKITCAPG